MATVIRGKGGTEDIRNMLYNRPKRMLDEYHENLFGDGGLASQFSDSFRSSAMQKIAALRDSRAARAISSSYRKFRNKGRIDRIEYLETIEEIRSALPRMQDLIMANPRTRKRWQEGRMAGYENGYSFKGGHRNAIKHSHEAFRLVMNETVYKDDHGYVANSYAMSDMDKDVLSYIDRAEVRQTWARVDEILWDNLDDPTSEYNTML